MSEKHDVSKSSKDSKSGAISLKQYGQHRHQYSDFGASIQEFDEEDEHDQISDFEEGDDN